MKIQKYEADTGRDIWVPALIASPNFLGAWIRQL